MKRGLVSIYCLIVFIGCTPGGKVNNRGGYIANSFVPVADKHIQYEGRVGFDGTNAAELYWPGTTIRFNFIGTGIKAVFQDTTGQNYFNVIIDGVSIYRIRVDTAKKTYTLAENLPMGRHTVELFKRTQIHKEYKRGYIKFYGFQLDNETKLLDPPPLKKRKMEFYGNSVTCGHAIEDTSGGDSGASMYENNYLSYAALTARHYNAQYACIAKSGIGLMVSFGALIMPEMYNLRNPFDSLDVWNFSKYSPDIVLINLLQNDAGIVKRPEYVHFKIRFGEQPPAEDFIIKSYAGFVSTIRNRYPNANIICLLGSMNITQEGSLWPEYVRKAVASLNDQKIFTHFFGYKNTPGHPRVNEHKIMSESLINFIDSNIKW